MIMGTLVQDIFSSKLGTDSSAGDTVGLEHSKIKCVIAKSFARIFYRNCINIGFPIMVCAACYDGSSKGDEFDVDLSSGIIRNNSNGIKYRSERLPDFVLDIVSAGGIMNYEKTHHIGGP